MLQEGVVGGEREAVAADPKAPSAAQLEETEIAGERDLGLPTRS